MPILLYPLPLVPTNALLNEYGPPGLSKFSKLINVSFLTSLINVLTLYEP